MTNFKLLLPISTALVLVAGASQASENVSYTDQSGDANLARITQSGNGNLAGASTARMTQQGDENRLIIDQTNTGLAAAGNLAGTNGLGIDQIGNSNVLEITQGNNKNAVRQVQQIGSDTGTALSNSAIVSQGKESRLSRILQENEGDGTDASNANLIDVVQQLTGNKIGTLTGFDNSVGLTQIGTGNDIDIDQLSSYNAITLVVQDGHRNALTVQQRVGNSNDALQFRQTGDDNEVSADQSGLDNVITSIVQTGDGNKGYITQLGDENSYALTQAGNDNDTNVVQTGDRNDVIVAKTGDGNVLDITQTGDDNTISVTLDGDGNNAVGSSFAAFFGSAGGLAPGDIVQSGNTNTATLTSGLFADNNLFAFKQDGNGNTVTGDIDGDGNQALVIQVGNTNIASFTQTGGSNFVSITQ